MDPKPLSSSGTGQHGDRGLREPRRFEGLRFRDQRRSAIIVATGPSAAEADLSRCAGYPLICVNDAYRLAPQGQALYAADGRWWDHHAELVWRDFPGALYCADRKACERYGLSFLTVDRRPGLSRKPGTLYAGGVVGNSGAQAINLAYLWGANRIVLVGFDMNDKGRGHFFGEHPRGLTGTATRSMFVKGMEGMAVELKREGVEVINTSMNSALPYWPKRPLDDSLELLP